MCKVIVKEPKKNAGFIIYNHLYSRNEASFTLDILKRELDQQYHLVVEESALKIEIANMLKKGIVTRCVGGYKRTALL